MCLSAADCICISVFWGHCHRPLLARTGARLLDLAGGTSALCAQPTSKPWLPHWSLHKYLVLSNANDAWNEKFNVCSTVQFHGISYCGVALICVIVTVTIGGCNRSWNWFLWHVCLCVFVGVQLHVADVQLHSNHTATQWSRTACVHHGSQAECVFHSRDPHPFQREGLPKEHRCFLL